MRKTEEIKRDIEDIQTYPDKVISELLLDIRNTVIQIHIGKSERTQ